MPKVSKKTEDVKVTEVAGEQPAPQVTDKPQKEKAPVKPEATKKQFKVIDF